MIVLKFGGTSVQDADTIKRAIDITNSREGKRVVVVSAFAGVTNKLVNIINSLASKDLPNALSALDSIFIKHNEVIDNLGLSGKLKEFSENKKNELAQLIKALDVLGEVSPKSKDKILSYGELLSSWIIFNAFQHAGTKVEYIDSREIIKTDSNYNEANVDLKQSRTFCTKICGELFKKSDIIIAPGFIAGDSKGNTTTLGRGGSDYSASIIASSLDALALEIWTDVSGVMTSDPRLIADARIIKELSYKEASELAFFGAKVIHPKTIYPAVKKQIPVWVLNSFSPEHPGTKIINKSSNKKVVKAIAFRKNVNVINVHSNRMLGAYGFLGKVFDIFRFHETSVDLVSTSEVSISLTIDDDSKIAEITEDLKKFATISIQTKCAIICAVGEGIKNTAGIAALFFDVLKGINIHMVSIGASEINISIVLAEKDLEKAVTLLHKAFFSNPDKRIFMERN